MEDEGSFTLKAGGEEWECNRDNTSLFTFMGKVTLRGMELDAENFNHVFHVYGEDDEGNSLGLYIFQHNPGFLALYNFLLRNSYPAHLNLREVAQCDQDAWENSTFKDLADYPPEWGNEAGNES